MRFATASRFFCLKSGCVRADRFVDHFKKTSTVIAKAGHFRRHRIAQNAADDFGHPETAFIVCSFWYVDALYALGREDEARTLFEKLLAHRNRHGLLSEDLDPTTGELWGNFPQTYSMVGLINSARKLSQSWERAF